MLKSKTELRQIAVVMFALALGLSLVYTQFVSSIAIEAAEVDTKDEVGDVPSLLGLGGIRVVSDGKEALIEWSKGEAPENLGFNIYREVEGSKELVNPSLIAGSAVKTIVSSRATGENYFWRDRSSNPEAKYFIEEIDLSGRTKLHGPVSPEYTKSVSALRSHAGRPNSLSLVEMTRVDKPSAQADLAPVRRSSKAPEKLLLSATAVEQTQWEIAGQYAPKISILEEGWYHITENELNSVKFDTGTERTKWQLYTGGEEVPMVVNTNGSIEFYGRGLDTPTSDTRNYYLIIGDGPGLRVTRFDGGSAGSAAVAPSFDSTIERKDRSSYISSIFNGEEENWFGPLVTSSVETVQELNVTKPDGSGQTTLTIKLQGLTTVGHQVNVKFNDFDLGVVSFNGKENRAFEFDVVANLILEGTNQVKLQSIGLSNDITLVDSVKLTYPRRFEAVDEKLRFRILAGQAVRFGGFVENEVSLYEINGSGIADRKISAAVEDSGGIRTFTLAPANYDREMLAIADSSPDQVESVRRNQPSSWNRSTNEANFVIIVPFEFYKYAEGIKFHRGNQGLLTEVVYMEDVYDEFSFGIHGPEAIKRFLERAATTWTVKPGYALLIGDSSFDPRNYLGQPERDFVPTKLIDTVFLETSSDAWLADFDDDGIEDIALGRWPAATSGEVEILYEKWLRYEWQPARTQRSNVMIADTGFEYYSNLLNSNLPADVQSTMIDRSGLTNGEMHDAIVSSLNAGPQIVTYTGHGTTGIWAHSSIFSLNDAPGLGNTDLSAYLLMTCLNGFTHGAYNSSIAEELFKSPAGGASLVWASSGTTYPNTQFEMTETLTNLIFNSSPDARVGDMIITSKQSTQDMDVRTTWQLNGDPTAVIK